MANLNKAVDQVRRSESVRLRDRAAATRFKNMRWQLLRRASPVRGRGPCVLHADRLSVSGLGASAITRWRVRGPEFVGVSCGNACNQWVSYSLACDIVTQYAPGHTPAEPMDWLKPGKTLRDHEQQHAQAMDDHTSLFEDRVKEMVGKCMTAKCESARMNDLKQYLAYQIAEESKEGALLDYQDANPGDPPQAIRDKWNDYLLATLNALIAYLDWARARDAADQACSSSP